MLEKWFLTDSGSNVMQAFLDELNPIEDLLHGETLLQFGSFGNRSFSHNLGFFHKWTVTPYERANSNLISFFNQLPIDRDSVDCVIAPLTLEAFNNKDNLINEIDRILKPMGYVVFFGINPLSLWGLWLRITKNNCFGEGVLKPKSVISVKLAMIHRGYVQCHLSSFYYIPPVRTKKWIDKLEIMNEVGKMISPVPSGFYCLVVQKQQENFIPLIQLAPKEQYVSPAIPPLQPT